MRTARDNGAVRADNPPNPSRRTLLARRTAALLAGAAVATTARVAPVASAGGDAEFLAACHDFLAADADLHVLEASDFEDDAIINPTYGRRYGSLERLTAIPALMQAKSHAAYVASQSIVTEGLQREEAAALSVLADLTGRAA